jgi:ADP-dependent NAD(P)H-hydrate dehydratase / NAD(P)H-hydrate epimerase
MPHPSDQILTAAQMRAAEAALIARGTSVEELMQRAGRGTAEWVWRIAGGRSVTVLTGPGNNGGDGWVIAEAIRQRGGDVAVVMAAEPATDAARNARAAYRGPVLGPDAERHGEVFVDCLFGTGLTRPLSGHDAALLARLAGSHARRVAVDLPSGIESDLGLPLNPGLPDWDLVVALGAWKPAHFLMPAAAAMSAVRLVEIGLGPVDGAARVIGRPHLQAPAADAHKYTRGLLGVIGGAMPGAALLAARAAQGAGAGYVKLYGHAPTAVPADLVVDATRWPRHCSTSGFPPAGGTGAGPGWHAREALAVALSEQRPLVLDADALVLLGPRSLAEHAAPVIATPHDGELFALERSFALDGIGGKVERALALARAANLVVLAKGPDSVVAAPDGRVAYAPRGPSWLSTAGTGDVLAGIIASRLACGTEAFRGGVPGPVAAQRSRAAGGTGLQRRAACRLRAERLRGLPVISCFTQRRREERGGAERLDLRRSRLVHSALRFRSGRQCMSRLRRVAQSPLRRVFA